MSMQTKVERLAMNDAYDWKTAQLLVPDIEWKVERISGYLEAFNKAGEKLDMAQEAKFFGKARERLVKKGFTGEKVSNKGRNVKVVLLVAGGLYVANRMGYLEPVKKKYRKAQLFAAAIKDPESQEYKDLVSETAGKISDLLYGEDRPNRFKNKNTVEGEAVVLEEPTEEPKDFESNVTFKDEEQS